jgi:endonuclease/exonuclease/phosphatase family metal-dependent hydrolase
LYRRVTLNRGRALLLGLCLSAAAAAAVVLVGWAVGAGAFGEDERATVKVMTFNVFYGGDDYDLAKQDWCATTNGCPATLDRVVEAIRSTGADVVGLEEGEGNTREIARRLGWHASPRTQIVSRFPLLEPLEARGAYVLAEPEPGKAIAVSSIHLPSDPYGPYAIRDGASEREVLAIERRARVPALTRRLAELRGVLDSGMPVFLVGDFNSPSQLDWTEAVDARREEVRYPVEWPVGVLAAEAGFRDSYREAYPDPVVRPGFTWTPGGPEAVKNEVHDRIDWVLVAGPADTVASEILGESAYPDTDLAADPFPSDHRGVVSTLSVDLADTPVLVSVQDRDLTAGEEVRVSYSAAGHDGTRLAIVPARTTGGWAPVEDTEGAVGTATLATAGLGPGAKAVVLVGADGSALARAPFWLYAPGTPVTVEPTETTYRADDPITYKWSRAPGNRWDWIGLYPSTEAEVPTDGGIPDDSGDYLFYEYTHTEIEGAGRIAATSLAGSGTWPLRPGRYELRMMVDDGYQTVARSKPFTVEASS